MQHTLSVSLKFLCQVKFVVLLACQKVFDFFNFFSFKLFSQFCFMDLIEFNQALLRLYIRHLMKRVINSSCTDKQFRNFVHSKAVLLVLWGCIFKVTCANSIEISFFYSWNFTKDVIAHLKLMLLCSAWT